MRRIALLALLVSPAGFSARGFAATPEYQNPRVMAMGGALRGFATGDAGPMLNPSGMALARSYTIEGAYLNASQGDIHNGHASIVDSTSGLNLSGGLFYTYTNASPSGAPGVTGHHGGFSLAMPFGEKLALGGTLRYLRFSTDASGTAPADVDKGLTFDLGATLRPIQMLSIGVVGQGLADRKSIWAPMRIGGGVVLQPIPDLSLAFDVTVSFTTWDPNRGNPASYMGGAEYLFARRVALRAGGGRDGLWENGYIAGGLSALSEMGAVDVGFRRDLSGPLEGTYIGVSLRLFVPAP